jgi:hypothetical protein
MPSVRSRGSKEHRPACATGKASRLKLVWIGPPCVNKAWDKNAAELDGILRDALSGTGVTYVSMRDASLCSAALRGKDGVHFNMEGYRNMWSRTAAASGYQVASISTPLRRPITNGKKQQRKESVAEHAAGPTAGSAARANNGNRCFAHAETFDRRATFQ